MVFLSQQANGLFTAETGYYPSCKQAFESDEYQGYLDSDFHSDAELLQLDSARVNNEIYNGQDSKWTKFVDPGFRGSADIREEVDKIPGYLMTGNPYDTADKALSAVFKACSDYKKPSKK